MATSKKPTTATTSIGPSCMGPHRTLKTRMIQNFHLVWLDGSIDEINNDDCLNSITKLRQVVNTVNTFTNVDECIDFISNIKDEKTFMISSGTLGQTIVPVVHDKPQVGTIYIFCGDQTRHEKWAKEWSKIKDVYTDITPICEALKQAAQDCDQNSVSISFVKSSDKVSKENLDQLDQSFMYTQILKEILCTIDFQQEHINEFLTYCRKEFDGNTIELKNVDMIEKEYYHHQPIWWYTYECFLYSMLNKALRTMEADLIITMGFFVRDLHKHITALHVEQYAGQNHSDSFTVYRGQGLSQTDFDHLQNTPGGLLSFNNFLSTSRNRAVSLKFSRRTITTSNLVGVLFVMKIDPSLSATPFANVQSIGYYQEEEKEILFSMHSVFRIGQVKQISESNCLWQVDLALTSDNDPQLHALTTHMRKQIQGLTGWYQLGRLMIEIAQFDKAEELYKILLEQTSDKRDKGRLMHQLGLIKSEQGKYVEAIEFYKKALEIEQETLPSDHLELATFYNNIGLVYYKMGEYTKTLLYYKKALEIKLKNLPRNHISLATIYNNIGMVCSEMSKHSEALLCYEKALEIKQKNLPLNHPSLATSYNNIGSVYRTVGEYSKALLYFEKDLAISQQTLPLNHPDLAASNNNIAYVYRDMGEYSKALSYYERALDILQRSLPSEHHRIQSVRTSIESVKKKL